MTDSKSVARKGVPVQVRGAVLFRSLDALALLVVVETLQNSGDIEIKTSIKSSKDYKEL